MDYEVPNDLSTSWVFSLYYELDTAGNIIRRVLGTDSNGTGGGLIFPTNDGGYISGNGYKCFASIYYTKVVGTTSKLDSNFQVVWTINAGPCSEYTTFEAISPSPDGNFMAVGEWYDDADTTQTHINGWIMKYSGAGQVIWSKLYRGVTSDGTNGDDNILASIAFMSDSSILCSGQALNNDGTVPPQQQGWLLHLDTAGCLPDSNSCGLPDGILNVPSQSMGSVKAYPNPASDQIQIEVLMDKPSAYTLSITNILGQTISESSLSQATTTTSIDVRKWPVGLYFYRVVSEDGFSRSGEFVVSR